MHGILIIQNLVFNITGCVVLTVLNATFTPPAQPGLERGSGRLIDQNYTTAPPETLDKSLLVQRSTVKTVEVTK